MVTPAQFFPGPLPSGTDGPTIPNIDNLQRVVYQGQQGRKLTGLASEPASAVALKFDGLGTGYWIAPVRVPEAAQPGTLDWEVRLDLAHDIPVGEQFLRVTATDADGHFGPAEQRTILSVRPLQPTGAAVATLTWDSNADLDLQIITPTGKQVDGKHPATDLPVKGVLPAGAGASDRDSNAGCVPDGLRQEDLVWPTAPTPGLYLAKVDMFASCGEPVANFVFRLYSNGEPIFEQAGRLLGTDADNGIAGDPNAEPGTRAAASALAITNFQF